MMRPNKGFVAATALMLTGILFSIAGSLSFGYADTGTIIPSQPREKFVVTDATGKLMDRVASILAGSSPAYGHDALVRPQVTMANTGGPPSQELLRAQVKQKKFPRVTLFYKTGNCSGTPFFLAPPPHFRESDLPPQSGIAPPGETLYEQEDAKPIANVTLLSRTGNPLSESLCVPVHVKDATVFKAKKVVGKMM